MNGEPGTETTPVTSADKPDETKPEAQADTKPTFWDTVGEKLPQVVIPAGVTVVVAAIALLGIQGDALTRLLRNYPFDLGMAITLTLLGTVALFFVAKIPAERKRTRAIVLVVATALVVIGVLWAVWRAIHAVGDRETPTLAFEVGDLDTAGDVPITITAAGLSLRTSDTMLLRVQGFGESWTARRANEACRNTVNVYAPEPKKTPAEVGLLYLAESGPIATGSTTSKIELTVDPDDYRWLCAVAVLSQRATSEELAEQLPPTTPPASPPATLAPSDEERLTDERFLSALLDLRAVPTPSPTPTPTTR